MISICPGLPLFSLCISHARMPLSPCVKCTPGMSVCSSVYVPIRMCVYQSYSQLCACMCPVAMQRLELAPHHITAHLLSHVGFFLPQLLTGCLHWPCLHLATHLGCTSCHIQKWNLSECHSATDVSMGHDFFSSFIRLQSFLVNLTKWQTFKLNSLLWKSFETFEHQTQVGCEMFLLLQNGYHFG